MLQLHRYRPWIAPRIARFNRISPSDRKSLQCQGRLIQSPALHLSNLLMNHEGKWKICSLREPDKMESPTNLNVLDYLNANILKLNIENSPPVSINCQRAAALQVKKKKNLHFKCLNFLNL
ncbi:hypothetical protein LguiA_001264 [Lonicera macranthoides]